MFMEDNLNLPNIEVLYEDDFLLVVNKPAGVLSQGTLDPKRMHVISYLQKQMPQIRFYLHHRLDKDTSGVLLLSKSEKANKRLTEIFSKHEIQKTYVALTKTKKDFSKDEWQIKNHLAPVKNSNRQLMRMVTVKKGGWYAETHFRLLAKKENFFYVEAQPITGRTHQIRVHLAEDKTPILGDFLYGGKSSLVPRLMLHAGSLRFPHPITNEVVTVVASLPSDFQKLLSPRHIVRNDIKCT
jgi:RluA family pseudouridine synthase